jgi:hypothetical protein
VDLLLLEGKEMRAPITDKQLLEMMWERFPEIMKRGTEQPAQQEPVACVEHDGETKEPCPSCGKPLQSASGGGVVCSGRCGYWFCF